MEKSIQPYQKQFVLKPVYNELKYLKTKININTDFCGNKILKKNSLCISLSVILLDHVIAIGENYYPQMFLEKGKYVIKEKKLKKIFDEKEISSDTNYEQNSD